MCAVGRRFLASASVLALAAVVAFLTVRRVPPAAGVVVASAPALAGTGRAFAVVETFDLARHRTVPATVRGVLVDGREATFRASGAGPVLVDVSVDPSPGTRRVTIRTEGEAGPGSASFDLAVVPAGGASSGVAASPEWPVRGRCGDLRVGLFAVRGVPAPRREDEFLILLGGPAGTGATATLASGHREATAPVQPWGGAVLRTAMPPLPQTFRLTLAGLAGGAGCRADLTLSAPPSPVLIEEARAEVIGKAPVAVVRTSARGGQAVYVLAAAGTPAGPGPLVAAAIAGEDGVARLPLPGEGVYQVRAAADPMQPGAAGADAMVVAGSTLPGPEWEGEDGPLPEAGRSSALPFLLAARAVAMPVGLAHVANTAAETRAWQAEVRGRREAVALSLLGAALGTQVLWAVVVVVRGARRRPAVVGGEGDGEDEAPSTATGRDLVGAMALALVLLCSIAATVYLLSTMQG